jgi:lipoic acid synthetase
MLGLGETGDEIRETLGDLRKAEVDIVTLGQYLQPTLDNLPVEKFYTPEEFDRYRDYAYSLGFRSVASGPLVRSSYHADEYSLTEWSV